MAGNGDGSSYGFIGETCINDLPDECLTIVVKFLENWVDREAFGLTCHRWLKIQSGVRLSIKIQFRDTLGTSLNFFKCLGRLLDRFTALNSVSLSGCIEIPDSVLTVFQSAGSKLKHLSLDCCFSITDEGLAYVSNGCTALLSLSLYRCNISDNGLGYVARGCPKLEIINLSYCVYVTDSGIAVISERCSELKVVTISFCRNIEGEGFEKNLSLQCFEAESCCLTDAGLCKTVKGGSLQFLNLSHSQNGIALGSRGFACIGMACSNLQFLYMRMCRTLEDLAVIQISKGCPLLKEWNLAVCPQVSVAGWQAVAKNCRNLEILHANRCRHFCDTSILSIRNGCPKLSTFYLHGCPYLSSIAVELFKQSRSVVRIIPQESMYVAPFVDKFVMK